MILIKPIDKPAIKEPQKKILFLVIKNKTIKEKPTEASPETNEQFVLQLPDNSNHGLKFSVPPNCKISLGRDLPHIFFNRRLTTIMRLKATEKTINKTCFALSLKLK